MLKALELVGFKSFADKTRLEFPRGITVVVGPNGSGKSNIVDAIKWVLGEQSVKSLRGKEMADVIFNGSATRRPLNTAETTLTIDNTNRVLGLDATEVQITRRVYRSGEGEYLINRQPCRLRDIRDLFAGTGVATEAYSVIEQGKVDVLLQSSPRERRIIFEEAAGISRFKTKKIESLRRLERVEQNLLRLSDIVDEVESRLKTVRLQANKARRYKEYSDRLQALRTQIGLADWRTLSGKLETLEAELQATREETALQLANVETAESQSLALETQINQADLAMRTSEARISQNRERIAARESAIEHQRRRCHDLEEEIVRYRRQLSSMSVRAGNLQQQLATTREQLTAAEQEHREIARRLAEEERGLTKVTTQVDELRSANEQLRAAHLGQLRAAGALGNRISGLESKVASTDAARQRGEKRLTELTAARETLAAEVLVLHEKLVELEQVAQSRQSELHAAQSELADMRRRATAAQRQLGALRQRHSGATERAAVLEELEKRLEGLSAGVKQVLLAAQGDSPGPYGQIRGLVADLLHVNYETAPLVEVALGEMAQCLVVAGGRELVAHLQSEAALAGRVGFVRLDVTPPKTPLDQIDLHDQAGVLGRADEFVETAPEFAVLARRLLGKTWIVETLAEALALSESVGRGLSFVTRAGELIAADGTLHVGPRHTSTGLISRRSELRALRQQIAEMNTQIEQQQAACAQLDEQIAVRDEQVEALIEAEHLALSELGQQRLAAGSAGERLAQVEKQHTAVEAELNAATSEHQAAATALTDSRSQLDKIDSVVADLEARVTEGNARASELELARQRLSRETNVTKVNVAKSEQLVAHLVAQKGQFERDQAERGRALTDSRAQLTLCLERLREGEREILQAESELAELYLRKESFAAQADRHIHWLMETRMTEMAVLGGQIHEGHPWARGEGAVLVDPAADSKKDKGLLVRGLVLGGGTASKSRDLGLFIAPEDKSIRLAAQIGTAVNRRFHTFSRGIKQGVANPKSEERIDLKVHPRYKDNIARYIRVVRAIPLRESASEETLRIDLLKRQLLDPITASTAALRLEAIGHPAVNALVEGINSSDPEVRFYAAEALGYLDESQAAAPLAKAARDEPAFRAYALAALSTIDDMAAHEELVSLLEVPSSETRYGAFRALWAMNPNDPLIRGENLGGHFGYHVLNTEGPPLVHVTRSFRPEVVLFGHEQYLEPPFMLEAGKSILVKGTSDGKITISKFVVGQPDQKRVVSHRLDEVIRAIVELGGTYPDVVQALQQAKTCHALPSRFEVDALPDGGRAYRHRVEAASETAEGTVSPRIEVANPLPDLFSSKKQKSIR